MQTIPQLKNKATRVFNAYIRARDKDKGCISCGARVEQAGHFYSGGHYSSLKYDDDNVHGQCLRCNYFLHGNLIEYEKRLRVRVGDERVDELHVKAGYFKRKPFKWDRFSLVDVITTYTQKIKEL
jgi:hypothetical protein